MEISTAIFLYSLTGLFLAVLYLIISNIWQNRQIKKTLKEIKILKNEIGKVSQYNKNIIQYMRDEEKSSLEIEEDTDNHSRKKRRKHRQVLKKIMKKLESKSEHIEEFFIRRLPDKLGIISFLTGIVFFVNYSMEGSWTNIFGRLFIGLLLAGVLLIAGYLVFKKFRTLSSVLLSGAISTILFTVFAGFYQYHIIGKWLSFSILIILIASSVLISIAIRRQEIAIITFLAAFIAPLTSHISSEDYISLFLYITLVNIGVIVYDYFKKSIIINLISYLFTFLTYAVWLITEFMKRDDIPVLPAFIFLTLFYIMIFIILIINNIRENRKFIPLEFTGLMVATGLYYSVGVILIKRTGMEYYGVFTAFIAVIQYIYFLILYPRKNFDRRILNLFLSLTIMFSALAVPVEYFGKSVTLVWAIQAGALMYIAIRSDLKPMYGGSINLTLGAVITLFYNLYEQYVSTTTTAIFQPFLNEGFFVSLITALGLFFLIFIINKSPYDYVYFKFIKKSVYQAVLFVIAIITIYLTIKFELEYYLMQHTNNQAIIKTYTSIFNFGFLLLTMLPSLFINKQIVIKISVFLGIVMLVLYIFHYAYIYSNLRNSFLLSVNVSKQDYNIHFYAVGLLFIAAVIMFIDSYKLQYVSKKFSVLTLFLGLFFLLYLISAELTNFVVIKKFTPYILIQDLVVRSHIYNYSLIWSIISFILIVIGIVFKYKNLVFSGILLYFIVFIKILTYDMIRLNSQDLTILFTTMGFIMLISAFLIQLNFRRLKTINHHQ